MNPNFILIFTCLALGIILRMSRKLPTNAHQTMNAFVIWISLPAVVLTQLPALLAKTEISANMLIPISMAWILFPLSFLTFYFLGKKYRWNSAETGALILTAGLGNTSFVGLPLLETFLGKEAIPIGILADQPGSFLALATVGLIVATIYSPAEQLAITAASIFKKVFSFPPFIALLIAVAWGLSGSYEASPITVALERLSITLVPLALVAVGFQLKVSQVVVRRQWKPLAWGLGFKLFLAPIFFIGLYVYLLGSRSFETHVTLLESAMAPMITAAVVAEEFGLNSEISSLMVGIGIPVSLGTVYFWNSLMPMFGF